jgi:hypothetical protein
MDRATLIRATVCLPSRQALFTVVCATSIVAGGCTLAVAPRGTPLASSPPSTSIQFHAGTTAVPLQPAGGGAEDAAGTLAERVRSLGPGRQLYLRFEDATAAKPGGVYSLYLNLPPDAEPDGVTDDHYIGSLSLSGVPSGEPHDIAVNVTPYLQRLSSRGALTGELRLAIVAAGTPDPTAAAVVQRVVLMAR